MFTQDLLGADGHTVVGTVYVSPWYDEEGKPHEYEGKCWISQSKNSKFTLLNFDPVVPKSAENQPDCRIEVFYETDFRPPLKLDFDSVEVHLTDAEKINIVKKELNGIRLALVDLDKPFTDEIAIRLEALIHVIEKSVMADEKPELRYISLEGARRLSLKDLEQLLPQYEQLPMPVSGAMLETIEHLREGLLLKQRRAARTASKKTGAGLVYIIQSPIGYKIGLTRGLKNRLRNIRTANPAATVYHLIQCEQPEVVESALQNYLADYRTDGEFFDLPDHILEELREIEGELSALIYCGVI